MEIDYPASHSMDATWFAVDAAGHVGLFDSGENGHVPDTADDAFELLVEMWSLRHPEAEVSLDVEEMAAELGTFFYSYDDDSDCLEQISTYERTNTPKVPLHLDQLPPALRQQAKQIRFEKTDFARSKLVQPLEEFSCVLWYQEDSVAYLCSDGKTMRPLPGKEDQFAEFSKHFREQNPKEAKKYIFEGAQQKTRKPRTRRGKENNDEK